MARPQRGPRGKQRASVPAVGFKDERAIVANDEPDPGFIAIDFGTSNSTVTLYDQSKIELPVLARNQAARLRDDLVRLIERPKGASGPVREEWSELVDDVARLVLRDEPLVLFLLVMLASLVALTRAVTDLQNAQMRSERLANLYTESKREQDRRQERRKADLADQRGSYLYNLNLSLNRSQRVPCALLRSGGASPLGPRNKRRVRDLFLVGGFAFNKLRGTLAESRRIEMRVEFPPVGEGRRRAPPRATQFGDCSLAGR